MHSLEDYKNTATVIEEDNNTYSKEDFIADIEDDNTPSQEYNNITETIVIEDDDIPSQEDTAFIVHDIQYPVSSMIPFNESEQDVIVGRICGNTVKKRSLFTLRPETWLNDEVINFYFKAIESKDNMEHDCTLYNSLFMFKLVDK